MIAITLKKILLKNLVFFLISLKQRIKITSNKTIPTIRKYFSGKTFNLYTKYIVIINKAINIKLSIFPINFMINHTLKPYFIITHSKKKDIDFFNIIFSSYLLIIYTYFKYLIYTNQSYLSKSVTTISSHFSISIVCWHFF